MDSRPVLSPVDYAAWSRGYMPPSEHVLIHHLQFDGARVVQSTTIGPGSSQVWVVALGAKCRGREGLKLLEAIYEAFVEIESKQAMTREDLYGPLPPTPTAPEGEG